MNYDDTLWSALRDALKSEDFDVIHVLNRAQIVDDALNLARAGQLSYNTALDIVSYLENEVEYYPWYSAFNAFSTLHKRISSDSELATYFTVRIYFLMSYPTIDVFNITCMSIVYHIS